MKRRAHAVEAAPAEPVGEIGIAQQRRGRRARAVHVARRRHDPAAAQHLGHAADGRSRRPGGPAPAPRGCPSAGPRRCWSSAACRRLQRRRADVARAAHEPEAVVEPEARGAGPCTTGRRPPGRAMTARSRGTSRAGSASRTSTATRSIVCTSFSGSMRPIATTVRVSRRRLGLVGLADAVVDHAGSCPGRRPAPTRPASRWPRTRGATTSARAVGGERETAREARRREALAGRRTGCARGREVALAHVDAVLGEQDRRAVERLVHERGDRGPARGRDMQQVGLGGRGARGAGDPVKSLVERRGLDRVERGEGAASSAASRSTSCSAAGTAPSRGGCERRAARRRGAAGTRRARRRLARGRRSSRSARPTRARRGARRCAALRRPAGAGRRTRARCSRSSACAGTSKAGGAVSPAARAASPASDLGRSRARAGRTTS